MDHLRASAYPEKCSGKQPNSARRARVCTRKIVEVIAKDQRSVSERLRTTTEELQRLEKLVLSGDCAPRVLAEFRTAVDNIRQTAWAVQQWSELQQQKRDPYSVLGILSSERVRRATQILKDLTLDLESLEVGLETEGLEQLFHAARVLSERLGLLFRKTTV